MYMVWTTKHGKAIVQLPDSVVDAEEIAMAEQAINMQLRSWRRAMEAEIASRWPFPEQTQP
jgi:HAMP domain-containing protein